MTFRQANQVYLIPGAQALMILGIIALCQPWVLFLHRYGLTIILLGLVGFIVLTKIAPEPEAEDEYAYDPIEGAGSRQKPETDPNMPKDGTM